jgi:hypothetical protein
MSIEIIGSSGTKLKLITEDKIDSIILEKKISYNLYKTKYLESSNQCKLVKKHLIIQLIKTFYKYDNTKTFDFNWLEFQSYLIKLAKITNLMEYINVFMIENKLFDKLNNAIITILKKIFKSEYDIQFIELNNNFYLDLLMVKYLLENKNLENKNLENKNLENKNLENQLNNSIINLENYISNNSIIQISNKNKTLNIKQNLDCADIIKILDTYLINLESIKGNILKIDSLINIIIENLYKFYDHLK